MGVKRDAKSANSECARGVSSSSSSSKRSLSACDLEKGLGVGQGTSGPTLHEIFTARDKR